MPLLSIFESAPESIAAFSIEQIVSAAGNGILKDGSDCSFELRAYLSQVSTDTIAGYIEHCLSVPFPKGGMVLQDLVNELGRRLDYLVSDGRYQGVQGKIGFDGLWLSPESHTLVLEVKTTDAYRLSLDTLAGYRAKLAEAGMLACSSSILIVVGRQDTGELEAQIRGSRHAWDIRVISAEALIKLVLLKENTDAAETGLKMRSLLTPIEYTRLDRMVDVMFATATDVDEPQPLDDELPTEVGPPTSDTSSGTGTGTGTGIAEIGVPSKPGGKWQFTDAQLMQAKREDVIAALGHRERENFVKKSRALFWNAAHQIRAACAMSKRYNGKNQAPYWYAYHPQWDAFLEEAERGFFVLGCMDRDEAFAIPHATMRAMLPVLHTTESKPGGAYWHVHIIDKEGGLAMWVREGEPLALAPFRLPLA